MAQRTEEQILTRTGGIVVMLGGKQYTIVPPVIKQARLFRQYIADLPDDLVSISQTGVEKPEAFALGLKTYMSTMPEKILDLFFLYACDLPRAEIEETATEAEVASALEEVLKQAFPLSDSLIRGLARSPSP